MVGRQPENQARSQVPGRVDKDKFRHSVATEDLSVNDSARRHLLAQLNTGNVAAVHLRTSSAGHASPWWRSLRMKRAANEKERRALMVSRLRPSTSSQQQQQQRGGAPASADHGQGRGQPEGGNKKQPKETPPPRPAIILAQ